MKITLETVSKRYALEWIFKKVSFVFESQKSYAIIGHNGSGKSTLLKLLSGIESASHGKLTYTSNGSEKTIQEATSHMSYVAPYQELIEEFTLQEHADFHFDLKGLKKNKPAFFELVPNLPKNKLIRDFSSGMKQRVKLALAFTSDAELILLDEPTTTLDEEGVQWYRNLCSAAIGKSTIIVSSNQKHEYEFVDAQLLIEDFK